MTDPFVFRPGAPRPTELPGPDEFIGAAGGIRVGCKDCPTKLARTEYEPFHWTHEDDEIVMKGATLVSVSKYDHAPNPDVIDVEVISSIP